ncbi:hypothetical protein BCR34DRAFT_594863 [Clohesyomyces aquaticus]|uniref:Uncharacterized protein n=1 Tax=Clohesyomyces aquaticus TaxID=1231657 RepID=A0A1Y1Y4C0_9PLEO|nr:hypothetical protein BCR34DRAFT_594863 [Clohesyomyces aquaticus]
MNPADLLLPWAVVVDFANLPTSRPRPSSPSSSSSSSSPPSSSPSPSPSPPPPSPSPTPPLCDEQQNQESDCHNYQGQNYIPASQGSLTATVLLAPLGEDMITQRWHFNENDCIEKEFVHVPPPTRYSVYTKFDNGREWKVGVGDCLATPSEWPFVLMACLHRVTNALNFVTGNFGWVLVPRPKGSKERDIQIKIMAVNFSNTSCREEISSATCLARSVENPLSLLFVFFVTLVEPTRPLVLPGMVQQLSLEGNNNELNTLTLGALSTPVVGTDTIGWRMTRASGAQHIGMDVLADPAS